MAVFQRSVLLSALPGEVYSFHEDPRNITRISPPSLQVNHVQCRVPAVAGEEFSLDVRQFGLRMQWIGVWLEAVPSVRLVDGAKRSPFRTWRHEHLFQAEGEGCRMTDRVSYGLPGGILGRLLDETVLRLLFVVMFHFRHRATADYFANRSGSKKPQEPKP